MLIKLYLVLQVVGSSSLSVQGLLKNEHLYKGILDCFSKTYKEAGIRGLYRGVGMHFCTAGISTVFILHFMWLF